MSRTKNTTLEVEYNQSANQKNAQTTMHTSITEILSELHIVTEARSILLLSNDGYLLVGAGNDSNLDISTICALTAANFHAISELAKLLGEKTSFKSNYQEGAKYNVYASYVDYKTLLVNIFGIKSKKGVVTYYTNKAIKKVRPLLTNLDKIPNKFNLGDDFDSILDNELDILFGESYS